MTSKTSDREIGLGVVGAGGIANYHLSALVAIEGAHVVTIADNGSGRAQALAQRFGIARAFSDYRRVVDSTFVDDVRFDQMESVMPEGVLATLRVLEAAYRSASSGKAIDITYDS